MIGRLWMGSIFGFLLGLGLAILLNPPSSSVSWDDPLGNELTRLLLASWLLLAFSGFVIGGLIGFITRRRD